MNHDSQIEIAVGKSATSKVWKNKKLLYSEFVEKLSEAVKSNYTYKEFIASSKAEQGVIKDVGGYVGGYLRNGKRSPKNVVHRQILTLDIDFAHVDFWDDFTLQFENAAVLHATHKHCEASPRYRLIMPLDREVTPDEYVAISRQIAGIMGIDLFDNTTFETNRLMFWPSIPKDVDYYFVTQDGPWLNADEILASYTDWKDTTLWPTAQKTIEELTGKAKKQEDPEQKKGIVGAFCRTYTISEAIEQFLSDTYTKTDHEDRYTYKKGSTAGGLILYEDKFAFSHHGTDPCSGKLTNAFDLVRIHLYGHLDVENSTSKSKPQSFTKMEDLVTRDKKVKKTIATENLSNAKYEFSVDVEEFAQDNDISEEDLDWMGELEIDTRGRYLSTATNINAILANDARLRGAFKQNDFDSKRYVFKTLPWRRIDTPEPLKNVDYSGVRNYIETVYGIAGTLKIDDSLALEFERNSFHPIQEYLNNLKWDGKSRIDNLLIDYFGAEDNLYSREAIAKTIIGAVARVFRPGCKFDLVLTLVGDQGTNKSSFFKLLSKDWFSDTFMTVQGKEALEQIQGAWIIEIAELSGFRKAEVEAVKHFLTKQEDQFRPAYARASEVFKRQCIFVGTTNRKDFLTDPTGNRRFMPIDVERSRITKDVWKELPAEVDQIWAEAVVRFKQGEKLYLSDKAEKAARSEQAKHSEVDDRKGLIEQYLDRKLPTDWDDREIFERRTFMEDVIAGGSVEREYVCIAEIWCECLGKDKENMSRYNTREINDIMKSLYEWEYHASTRNFKIYGKQKYYSRRSLL